ncbi:recombinase family protein [Mycobacteroides chelonae]|uniref:recombinase family protein n=1 Tax=Mycobacteroides chelonae TaxID=1774 RepID=UPI0008A8E8FB|nr:recombinase family protein [Mycobacteroides chelonae]MEC4872015.1 recombinase family protein [Mycobacteroides chelonae]OHU15451.1 resolvase [Mycobacteroides chelonae]
MKALIVVRLSRVTDATTSPERQLQMCQELCSQRGYEVVGTAEDLDVSGAVDPFKREHRPGLAPWLAGERDPFDVIVVYRVDRLTRSIRNLQTLVAWAEDSSKLIVSATEPHFDMTSPFAAVVIALMGTVAQMELDAISQRTSNATQYNLRAGKYRGGPPPWGYRPDDSSGEWRLIQDPDQVALIREIVRRVLDGDPLQRIAHDLTRRGVPTAKGRQEWFVTPLKRALLSEALLGYAMSKGTPIRKDDGSPVVRSEPILTRETFDQLKVELANRSKRGDPTKRSHSLLLRVIYCGVCELPVYKFNGGRDSKYPKYRCSSVNKHSKCGNRTIRATDADEAFTENLLGLFGDSERLERVWDSGSDNSAELANLTSELENATTFLGSPAYRLGTPQRAALDARLESLAARQDELSREAVQPAGWLWKTTGESFAAWWENQDTESRNIWLRSMNIQVSYDNSTGPVTWHIDWGDLKQFEEQLKFGESARRAVRQISR